MLLHAAQSRRVNPINDSKRVYGSAAPTSGRPNSRVTKGHLRHKQCQGSGLEVRSRKWA